MPSISDQLKSLGVKVGARNLPPSPLVETYPVERIIPGRVIENPGGVSYVVESIYSADYQHGDWGLHVTSPLELVAAWAGESRIHGAEPGSFAFLDIETTGLSYGTGTYAFLVGVGRYQGDEYHLAQFFMRDPTEEQPHLLALEEFLAPCDILITFSGKSFDIPLLNTRYLAQGWRSPFCSYAHIDLLYLARRLWRDRLPSRTLGNLEVQILGHRRTQADIPGWMVPQMYFDYLHTGDARPLVGVFYHNAMDVISLAALLNRVAHLLDDPLHTVIEHDLDWAALGRLFDELDRGDAAIELYHMALGGDLPPENRDDILRRLSFLHKRRGELDDAMALWQQAAESRQVYACVELAKAYEHSLRDLASARRWTQTALEWMAFLPYFERLQWQEELEHRRDRLQRKLEAGSS